MPTKPFQGVVCLLSALAVLLFWDVPGEAALLGNNFEISGPGCRFPDVAFGSGDSKYLVVWPDYNVARIFGRFVTATVP